MRWKAAVTGKCPHCLQGKIFRSLWQMNERCAICGIKFEREEGYFMMAIFIGYILSGAVVLPVLLLLYLLASPTIWGYVIAAAVALVLASPLIFRYGRILWLHIDELLDPRKTEADRSGDVPTPHGIDLMLTHEDETADTFYTRKDSRD